MDDWTSFTERDLARLELGQRLAAVADSLHDLVGRHGHDVPPGTWLGDLVGPVLAETGELRRLAVRYERSRGTSWERIGEILGVDPAEAERRWGTEPAPGPRPEPAQLARELDTWFVRRLWTLEATEAAIADPVSRLLDATGPAPASCLICRKYDGDAVPAWAGRAEPPGGHLIDDGVWRVSHAPTVFSPAGSLLVESRRHFLDYADMEPHEASTYGALVGRFFPVIKKVTGVARIHVMSTMDGAPHFHVWLVPRRAHEPAGRRFMVNPGACTETEAAEAVHAMREVLAGS